MTAKIHDAAWHAARSGRRTLLAKTCAGCSQLRNGSSFRRKNGYLTSPYCYACELDAMKGRPIGGGPVVRRNPEGYRTRHRDAGSQKLVNDRTRDTAHRYRHEWTDKELEFVRQMSAILTDTAIALKLGRTTKGIRQARRAYGLPARYRRGRGDPARAAVALPAGELSSGSPA